MDNKPDKYIEIPHYTSLDDLPMRNWINANKKDDLSWIIMGYKGFPKQKLLPLYLKGAMDVMKEDYEEKTRGVESSDYYELLCDRSDLEMRFNLGKILTSRILKRPFMNPELLNGYADELAQHRFYIDKDKPLIDEIKKIQNQLESIKMKITMMTNEIDETEKGLVHKGVPVLKLKTRVQKITGQLDFNIMTVTEWLFLLEDIASGKAAA